MLSHSLILREFSLSIQSTLESQIFFLSANISIDTPHHPTPLHFKSPLQWSKLTIYFYCEDLEYSFRITLSSLFGFSELSRSLKACAKDFADSISFLLLSWLSINAAIILMPFTRSSTFDVLEKSYLNWLVREVALMPMASQHVHTTLRRGCTFATQAPCS